MNTELEKFAGTMSDRRNIAKTDRPRSSEMILSLLRQNPVHSAGTLAKAVGISRKGIEKQLSKLKARGELRRIGAARGGRWEVL